MNATNAMIQIVATVRLMGRSVGRVNKDTSLMLANALNVWILIALFVPLIRKFVRDVFMDTK
jgi:hypothetical protein